MDVWHNELCGTISLIIMVFMGVHTNDYDKTIKIFKAMD